MTISVVTTTIALYLALSAYCSPGSSGDGGWSSTNLEVEVDNQLITSQTPPPSGARVQGNVVHRSRRIPFVVAV